MKGVIKKILYIGFQYDYGKKESGYAMNYKAWYENFIRFGYEVEAIFYEDYSKESLQKEILKRSSSINPDLIFFILQKDQVLIETLRELKRHNFFTANFFGDDQWRFDNFTSKFAVHFSTCITTDKFSVDKYKIIGQENVIRSQWASLNSYKPSDKVKYRYDVSFIGGVSPYRKWFVSALAKKGIKVDCFGSGWNKGRVTYEQMEEIFQSSKINLNISNSINYDVRYLMSSLKILLTTLRSMGKNGKNRSQIKARNFEIPVQGGFQLTDYVPTIEEYFYIGKEVVCYRDIDEAELLINYYLKHQEEREIIKLSGVEKARKEHTFKNRIIEIMLEIERIYDKEK